MIALVAGGGCVAHQPDSRRTVAAFEVPLPSPLEQAAFLSLLREEAMAEGLHVDAASRDDLDHQAEAIPAAAMTIHAAIYRGAAEDHAEGADMASEAVIMDLGHPGHAWIMFSRGEDPALATRFREHLMMQVIARWPETLSLPIMPTGSIPHRRQLIATPDGYKLDPDEIEGYGVSRDSPLVLQPEASS